MSRYVAAIDQGTTSTRCILFDRSGTAVAMDQQVHRQIYPQPGWVEHDPLEILDRTRAVIAAALAKARACRDDLAAVGIANQRETIVLWERASGRPLHRAIVWQDTRSDALCAALAREGGQDRFRARTGLPLSTYFSGPKLTWLLDHIPGARSRAERGELLCGTIDTWLLWHLSGGAVHLTDVSNASRTLLMNLKTLDWDPQVVAALGIPSRVLPQIRSSSEIYAEGVDELAGVPLAGALGDQQAALFGQACFAAGEAKNTYGTGCFLLLNTGGHIIHSSCGLLSTVAYRLGGQTAVYALEGAIAITGALVQWLRDNLGLIGEAAEIEDLARTTADNGGVYFVPAFSGLYAPHWHSEARGLICGLTGYAHKGHLARAALEATAYQTREVWDAMRHDTGLEPEALKVDGGMTGNETLLQFQADILGVPVIRPTLTESTALGAAYAAGLAVGFWPSTEALRGNWREDRRWLPALEAAPRERLYAGWQKAVRRAML